MHRNGGTTIFSSDSIVLLGDREMSNLTFRYKLCSPHYILLYTIRFMLNFLYLYCLYWLVGWIKINERQLGYNNILDTRGRTEDIGTTAME